MTFTYSDLELLGNSSKISMFWESQTSDYAHKVGNGLGSLQEAPLTNCARDNFIFCTFTSCARQRKSHLLSDCPRVGPALRRKTWQEGSLEEVEGGTQPSNST